MAFFFDNSSTTPLDPVVIDRMVEVQRSLCGNPASQHAAGQAARHELERCRDLISSELGAARGSIDRDLMLFTSGATESNNLAIFGLAGDGQSIVTSSQEHPSVSLACDEIEKRGTTIHRLPLTSNGIIQLDKLEALLTYDNPALVSISMANHETGVIQPMSQIAEICRRFDVPLHCDAAQAACKLPILFDEWGLSVLTVSPHKFHGPVGIGGLLIRRSLVSHLRPQIFGGFQQSGLRPGTESVALASGFAAAVSQWADLRDERIASIVTLRDRFEATLSEELGADVFVIGQDSPRLPGHSNLAFIGMDRQELFLALDMAGVACSTGSACASGSSEPSPVHLAMGLTEAQFQGALRFTFSSFNTTTEIAEGCDRILSCVNHLRQRKDDRFSRGLGRQ